MSDLQTLFYSPFTGTLRETKMAQTKFLITGATGATGGYTARQLLATKQAVRVLAHRADDRSKQLRELGAEVVLGDFLDFDAIRAALQGVQHAYFCYPISPGIVQASAQFAQAAKEAGVEVIVNMSQKSARSDAKSVAARQHWLSEFLAALWRDIGQTGDVDALIDRFGRRVEDAVKRLIKSRA